MITYSNKQLRGWLEKLRTIQFKADSIFRDAMINGDDGYTDYLEGIREGVENAIGATERLLGQQGKKP